jgi:hypothetical protein
MADQGLTDVPKLRDDASSNASQIARVLLKSNASTVNGWACITTVLKQPRR